MKKVYLPLLLSLCMILTFVPIKIIAEIPPMPIVSGNNIYANGVAIIVDGTDDTHTTVYIDYDRDGVRDVGEKSLYASNIANAPADGSDLSNRTIFGGAKTGTTTADSMITINGGKVGSVYGANGSYADMAGGVTITMNSGSVARLLACGYNNAVGGTGKTVAVTINGGTVRGGADQSVNLESRNKASTTSLFIGGGIIKGQISVRNTGTFVIKGGNILASIKTGSTCNTNPTNDDGIPVYKTTLTLTENGTVKANTAVSALTTDAGYTYGMTDVKTDALGMLYAYLPAGETVTEITSGDDCYTGSITTLADGTASGDFSKTISTPPCVHEGGIATCHTLALCTKCGTEYGSLNPDNHNGATEIRNASAAECEQEGYTGDTYCLGCDELIQTGTVTQPLTHDFSEIVIDTEHLKTSATCTAQAVYYYNCDRCNEISTTNTFGYGKALGHSFTNYTYNNNATYYANGTETAQCNRCDETDTRISAGTMLIDNVPPTGEIKISENSFKDFEHSVTFGLFFKESQTVTIIGADVGIGLDKIYYTKSETALTLAAVVELSADKWTEGSLLSLYPDWQGVVYAKITDKSGNTLYISSDGLVLDSTAPIISGVADNGKYCNTAPVQVTVIEANLDTVELDGETVILAGSMFTVPAKDGAQEIVVTDKAGNETSVTVTVYANHIWNAGIVITEPTTTAKGEIIYTCAICGETRTEEIDKLAPSITEGNDASYTEGGNDGLTFKSNAAFTDFVSVSVDGNVIDTANYTATEGSTVVTLTADYLATLSVGKHTLAINSTTGTASAEFTITSDSTESQSPQTEHTSTLILRIVIEHNRRIRSIFSSLLIAFLSLFGFTGNY